MRTTEYLVGFDRFVALDWANFALELSAHSEDDVAKVSELKSWLSLRVSGTDASRKTANVLTRLWLDNNPNVGYFRDEALKIKLDTKKSDLVIFHWGMAFAVFPFFYEVCTQAGRLFALQPRITRRDIQTRVAEKYSNQGTIPRSVDRVLQSLVDWGMLEKLSTQELGLRQHKTSDALLKKWLLETIVFSAPNKRILIQGLYKLPSLFPFEYNGDVVNIISNSLKLKTERAGDNFEYVVWKT